MNISITIRYLEITNFYLQISYLLSRDNKICYFEIDDLLSRNNEIFYLEIMICYLEKTNR